MFTALTYMVGPKSERPIKRKDGSVVDLTPGLTMILKYKPDINITDLDGHSVLQLVVCDQDWDHDCKVDAVKKLVFILIL